MVSSTSYSSGCTAGALMQNLLTNRKMLHPTTAIPPRMAETRTPVSIGLLGCELLDLSPDSTKVSQGSPLIKHGGTLVPPVVPPGLTSGVSGF